MGHWIGFLFQPHGRASRSDIWMKFALPFAALSLLGLVADFFFDLHLPDLTIGPITGGLIVFFLWPSFAVTIKRAHDRGLGAGWALLFQGLGLVAIGLIALPSLAPGQAFMLVLGTIPMPIFLGFILGATNAVYAFVVLYCLPGDLGENAYGRDPLEPIMDDIARHDMQIFN